MWLRLRQIAFVAEQLAPVEAALIDVLGVKVCFNDPGVGAFGLHNALYPVGSQFIEVVAPKDPAESTAGRRYLDRRGGDGGYMVITQCDDQTPRRAKFDALGIRLVSDHTGETFTNMQLHPKDTGGSFFEIDQMSGEGAHDLDGPWHPAGPNWTAGHTDRVAGISAAVMQCNDPDAVASRWSAIAEIPLAGNILPLDNAELRFVPCADGRPEGLSELDIVANDLDAVLQAADKRGVRSGGCAGGDLRDAAELGLGESPGGDSNRGGPQAVRCYAFSHRRCENLTQVGGSGASRNLVRVGTPYPRRPFSHSRRTSLEVFVIRAARNRLPRTRALSVPGTYLAGLCGRSVARLCLHAYGMSGIAMRTSGRVATARLRGSLFAVAGVVWCAIAAYAIAAEAPLTNEDVLRLAAAGLDGAVIVAKIESSDTAFDTSVDALVELAGEGLNNDIVAAMVAAAGNRSGRAPASDGVGARPAGTPAAGASGTQAARPKAIPGSTFRETLRGGGEGPEMVVVPAGRFRMGCLSNDHDCFGAEKPVHEVAIAQPFALSSHEVTFEDYDRFTYPNKVDDEGWGRGSRPVVNVSWGDAKEYAAWLSSQTGAAYRLPSEAEWEYAARAGSAAKYSWGDEIGANRANCGGDFCGDRWQNTAPVGSFGPNGFGLYDMHGNVLEWVEDCWNRTYAGAPLDGTAWLRGDCGVRVLRGGSWYYAPRSLRAAYRVGFSAGNRDSIVGFRVARTLAP